MRVVKSYFSTPLRISLLQFFDRCLFLPFGEIHTPGIWNTSSHYNIFRDKLSPVSEVATNSTCVSRSLSIHVPFFRVYYTRYRYYVFTLRAPHVTSMKYSQILLNLCIDDKNPMESTPNYTKS